MASLSLITEIVSSKVISLAELVVYGAYGMADGFLIFVNVVTFALVGVYCDIGEIPSCKFNDADTSYSS